MTSPKVSVIIPVYKPENKTLEEIRKKINSQTIPAEIIENWNMPEAVSMNTGIKKAKGEIIVILAQDCVPSSDTWLESLVKPLENKKIVVSVSDLLLPEWYWRKYPFFTRILTLKELKIWRPFMDMRACAYRKKDLLDAGLVNEDPRVIGIDSDLYLRLKSRGEVYHPGVHVYHLHPLTNKAKLKMLYNYAEGGGKEVRKHGMKVRRFTRRILRALPFFGLASLLAVFPYKKYWPLFPAYLLLMLIEHVIWVYAFWKGFFIYDTKSQRNTEVLNQKS